MLNERVVRSDGVKAPDPAVAAPDSAEATHSRGFPVLAREINVEIVSSSNSWEEWRQELAPSRHRRLGRIGLGYRHDRRHRLRLAQ
jgi:hypothetical protein